MLKIIIECQTDEKDQDRAIDRAMNMVATEGWENTKVTIVE